MHIQPRDFSSRKFCEEKQKIYLGICQKWIVISCSSSIIFLSFSDENGKKGRNSLLHYFDLIFDELSIVRATQKEVKWPQLLLSRKRYFFDKKKHVFSTISSVALASSIHSIVIGCLLFVRFWPTFCKHMLLPKIVQLQKKELDEFLSRFAEINCLPIRIHE